MTVTCSTVRQNISDYIDSVASRDLAWRIDMHIVTCAECADLVRSMRQTVSILGQVQPKPLSADFDTKLAVKLAVARQMRPTAAPSKLHRWLETALSYMRGAGNTVTLRVGVAAAALSIACIFLVMPKTQTTDNPTGAPHVNRSALASADQADSLFAAACANEQNQNIDNQTLNDPAAQALAARFDEAASDNPQPLPAASPVSD